jgi:hypothetical protein
MLEFFEFDNFSPNFCLLGLRKKLGGGRRERQFFFWKNQCFFWDTPPPVKKGGGVGKTFFKEFFDFVDFFFKIYLNATKGGNNGTRERRNADTTSALFKDLVKKQPAPDHRPRRTPPRTAAAPECRARCNGPTGPSGRGPHSAPTSIRVNISGNCGTEGLLWEFETCRKNATITLNFYFGKKKQKNN